MESNRENCPHRVECSTQFGSHRSGVFTERAVLTGWGVPHSFGSHMKQVSTGLVFTGKWRVIGRGCGGRIVHTGWSVPYSLGHIKRGVFTWLVVTCVGCSTQFGPHRSGVFTE